MSRDGSICLWGPRCMWPHRNYKCDPHALEGPVVDLESTQQLWSFRGRLKKILAFFLNPHASANWYMFLEKNLTTITKSLNVCTLDPAIPLLGIFPKEIIRNETLMYAKECSVMCINEISILINTMGYYAVVRSHIIVNKTWECS